MEPLCEFCGVVRAVVYCNSDSARLCLNCDASVHSSNPLSRRHARSLLCDHCYSQAAVIRCVDHNMCVCEACEWNRNECLFMGHGRLVLKFYTGCPSFGDLSRLWSFVFDANSSCGGSGGGGLEPISTTLSGNVSCTSKSLEQPDNDDDLSEPWMDLSPIIPSNPDSIQFCKDQALFFPPESNQPKGCPNFKDLGIEEGNGVCEGLTVDDVIQLNFENADEIFGCFQLTSYNSFKDGGLDCLLMDNDISVTESKCLAEDSIEASSPVQQDCVTFQSASVMPANAINNNVNSALENPIYNSDINLGFPHQVQVHSSTSMQLSSNITGDSSATDLDCELSSMVLKGEESTLEGTCPQRRAKAKMRYNEKKENSNVIPLTLHTLMQFGKQIRYASRKARAETRKRVKGRFVKAGEEYDYDPLLQNKPE